MKAKFIQIAVADHFDSEGIGGTHLYALDDEGHVWLYRVMASGRGSWEPCDDEREPTK